MSNQDQFIVSIQLFVRVFVVEVDGLVGEVFVGVLDRSLTRNESLGVQVA